MPSPALACHQWKALAMEQGCRAATLWSPFSCFSLPVRERSEPPSRLRHAPGARGMGALRGKQCPAQHGLASGPRQAAGPCRLERGRLHEEQTHRLHSGEALRGVCCAICRQRQCQLLSILYQGCMSPSGGLEGPGS